MKNSVLYIVGATLLVGGAFLFLKNKKKKDADKLAEAEKLAGTTSGGATPSGATPSATTPSEITPNLSQPVKVDKDLNLDTYNLQNTLEEFKKLEEELKNPPKKGNDTYSDWTDYQSRQDPRNREYWKWYDTVFMASGGKRVALNMKLSKLGYKFDNGLLVKI